jgi:hypothetical protein
MAAKFLSRMSLMNNHLWTEFLLRHCPTHEFTTIDELHAAVKANHHKQTNQ